MSRQSPADLVNKFVKEAVNKAQDGPVPEVVLYRLLSVAEAVFRQELETDGRRLAGLRLGYALEDKVSENAEAGAAEGVMPHKLYWVGWGDDPIYDELLEPEKTSSGGEENHPEIDASSSALPEAILKELINQLQEEMIRNTPPTLLEGKVLRPFLFGHTIKTIKVPVPEGQAPDHSPVDGGDGGIGGGSMILKIEMRSAGCVYCSCPGIGVRQPGGGCKPARCCNS